MRLLVWFLILAAVAVGLAVAGRYNDGYALLVLPPWRIEMSFNLLAVLVISSCGVVYLLLHAVASVVRMPSAVAEFRVRRARARADGALRAAMLFLQEGRYSQAIKSADTSFLADHAPGLAALIGLRAAHALRDDERIREWGERLRYNEAGMRAVRLKTEAELALDNHDYELARERVDQLLAEGGRHIAALRLSLRVHQAQGDWTEVLKLARQLEKHKALTPEQAAPLRMRAHRENIAALEGDADQLARYWHAMPDADKQDVRLALAAARALGAADNCGQAAVIVEDFLDHRWDSTLAAAYGQCQGGDVVARIAHAEKWLNSHPRDASLLLTLGRLCRQKQLWGKAQSYLEASLAVEASAEAHLELASLLENELEKSAAAERHYKQAALLGRRPVPRLHR
ncbi:MAG: heme biosynthesis protein HemY [Rhodocyclales bacterium]|nr:heme biosynthesis protein HemY [Rhodocyclales bacterium]